LTDIIGTNGNNSTNGSIDRPYEKLEARLLSKIYFSMKAAKMIQPSCYLSDW
jgi:hypothetical protein